MLQFLLALLAAVRALFRARIDAALEILALRQQVAVLKRKRPRPPLNACDRLFWTTLRRFWPCWSDVLLVVKPETVIAWHRAGFRLYWRWRSRARGGRPRISRELQQLIARMAKENPNWGDPKIHAELGWPEFRECLPPNEVPIADFGELFANDLAASEMLFSAKRTRSGEIPRIVAPRIGGNARLRVVCCGGK